MKIAFLWGRNGREIKNPVAVDGSISWQEKTGEAMAFGEDGKTLIGKLKFARIKWIEAGGIRIEGVEEASLDGEKVRFQAWHVRF